MSKVVIDELREKHGLTRVDAEMAYEQVTGAIKSAVERTGRVQVRGFGVFHHKQKPGRQARNPQTGETIHVASRMSTTFREERK